ncbi:MAG: sucrase ferredoxin [Cyanobacteria bacterium P01_G01_bin.19]
MENLQFNNRQTTSMKDVSTCRYCSEVSQIQGEDPIGTAGMADEWLIIEVPRPWKRDIWQDKPEYRPIIGILQEIERRNPDLSLRLMAIAPDKGYSSSDDIRVFYYCRPAEIFARYEKQEYIVSPSHLIPLVKAILLEPEALEKFASDRQNTTNIREILVCTHTQWDTACGRYGTPLYEKLRKQYVPESDGKLRVWHTSHFGGHKFAPTLIDFPSGRFWGHLKPELLNTLIYEEGDLKQLEQCYRGWSGMEKFAQIAEREIWLQEGWKWKDYPKSGRIVTRDRGSLGKIILRFILQLLPLKKAKLLLKLLDRNPKWVEVEIVCYPQDLNNKEIYRVKVEAKGKVLTAGKSSKQMQLKPVTQYRVREVN